MIFFLYLQIWAQTLRNLNNIELDCLGISCLLAPDYVCCIRKTGKFRKLGTEQKGIFSMLCLVVMVVVALSFCSCYSLIINGILLRTVGLIVELFIPFKNCVLE